MPRKNEIIVCCKKHNVPHPIYNDAKKCPDCKKVMCEMID